MIAHKTQNRPLGGRGIILQKIQHSAKVIKVILNIGHAMLPKI